MYESEKDSEDEPDPPVSPPHSSEPTSPFEDRVDESENATPTPEPAFIELVAGPSQIPRTLPEKEPKKPKKKRAGGKATKENRKKISISVASSSAGSSATSSRQNSHSLDHPDTAAANLQMYILDAKGHKRYPCLHCDKMFGRSHDRKRHMEESTSCRGTQGGQDGEATPMWVCERCGDSFSRRDSLNRHMKNPDACKAYKRLLK